MGDPVTAFIATALISVGVPGTVTAGVATGIAGGIASTVVGLGVSAASSLLLNKKAPGQPRQEFRSTINQAAGERVRGYGQYRMTGVRAFWGARNGKLYQVIAFHHGQVHAIDDVFIGDISVEIDDDGIVTTEPFVGDSTDFVRIVERTGTPGQLAFQEMIDAWPGKWTDDHRLRGLACLFNEFTPPKIEYFQEVFPEGANTPIRIGARLTRCYDPRTGATAYTRNAALHVREYLTSADGYRLTSAQIDDASFIAKANLCEQILSVPGGSEARYNAGGVYSLQEEPKVVLGRLLAAGNFDVYQNALGKVAIKGGEWTAPTVMINLDNLVGFEMEEGANRFAAFNSLRTLYTEPAQDYQMIEAPRWFDADDIAERGDIPSDLRLDNVQSQYQAQRLARIHKFKANPRWRGTLRTDVTGLNARYEPTIQVVIPELSINETMSVDDHGIIIDGGVLVGCEIVVSSLPAEAYDPPEYGVNEPEEAIAPDFSIEVPLNLIPTVELRSIGGLNSAPVVVLTVDAPIRTDLTLEAQIRLDPAGPWEGMTSSDDGVSAVSNVVIDGEDYNLRARWRTAGNTASDWSALASISV